MEAKRVEIGGEEYEVADLLKHIRAMQDPECTVAVMELYMELIYAVERHIRFLVDDVTVMCSHRLRMHEMSTWFVRTAERRLEQTARFLQIAVDNKYPEDMLAMIGEETRKDERRIAEAKEKARNTQAELTAQYAAKVEAAFCALKEFLKA